MSTNKQYPIKIADLQVASLQVKRKLGECPSHTHLLLFYSLSLQDWNSPKASPKRNLDHPKAFLKKLWLRKIFLLYFYCIIGVTPSRDVIDVLGHVKVLKESM